MNFRNYVLRSLGITLGVLAAGAAQASSHREAPAISAESQAMASR